MTDPDYDKIVETLKGAGLTGDEPASDTVAMDKLKRYQHGQVTMNRPVQYKPMGAFAKTLALHIHQATRPAKHSHLAANYGIMDNEQDARRWDFEGVKE